MKQKRRIRLLLAAADPAYLYRLVGKITAGKDMMVEASAHTGRGAVKKLAMAQPDMVLLEFGMCGTSQIRMMKQACPTAHLILLTNGKESRLGLAAAVAEGVDGVLRKNAPCQKVLASIRKVYKGGKCLPRGLGNPEAMKRPRQKVARTAAGSVRSASLRRPAT
jgi:DNA-binding NarL/FixJ family response regulator